MANEKSILKSILSDIDFDNHNLVVDFNLFDIMVLFGEMKNRLTTWFNCIT